MVKSFPINMLRTCRYSVEERDSNEVVSQGTGVDRRTSITGKENTKGIAKIDTETGEIKNKNLLM